MTRSSRLVRRLLDESAMMTRLLIAVFVILTGAAAFTLSGCGDDNPMETQDLSAPDLRPSHD